MRIYNFSSKYADMNVYINMDVVSHIKIDSKKNKIYFNMAYSILGNNNDFIQDYIYVERNAENLEMLYEAVNTVDFISYDEGKWVNRNTISSFKYDPTNCRVIINLSTAHTYTVRDNIKVMSEFVYMNNVTNDGFKKFVEQVSN